MIEFILSGLILYLALWPIQPPIQWAPWALSSGVRRSGSEVDHSPPSSAEVKNGGAIPQFLIRLLGVVISIIKHKNNSNFSVVFFRINYLYNELFKQNFVKLDLIFENSKFLIYRP
jgi:hypothetical protein